MSRSVSPATAVFAAWLVPGGGHFLLGRRTQAVFFFVTITAAFLFGMFLCDFTNVSPDRHGYYFIAHIMNGATAMLASLATAGIEPTEVPRHFGIESEDIGTLYTAVAALLNVIVVMNAWSIAAGLPPPVRKKKRKKAGKEVAAS